VNVKDRVRRAIEEMPDDVSFEDIIERICILQKVERGRQQMAAREEIPHEEARRQIKRWHD
jgi:hypothetical protein